MKLRLVDVGLNTTARPRLAMNGLTCRIQSKSGGEREHINSDSIPFQHTLHVWSANVHNVAGDNVSVFLIKAHPFPSNGERLDAVIETRTSITSCHSITEVLGHRPLILQEIVRHGVKLCSLSTCTEIQLFHIQTLPSMRYHYICLRFFDSSL